MIKNAVSYCVLCLQLLVGSEDFDIRVFKEDELVSEMTENEVNECDVLHSLFVCLLQRKSINTDNSVCFLNDLKFLGGDLVKSLICT